jgi:hypothetical protein
VTTIFRREDDAWKIAHRHADPITTPRPIESAFGVVEATGRPSRPASNTRAVMPPQSGRLNISIRGQRSLCVDRTASRRQEARERPPTSLQDARSGVTAQVGSAPVRLRCAVTGETTRVGPYAVDA